MADVIFCQQQNFFKSEPFARWARLIIYEDDYSDCLLSESPFLFEITTIPLFIGEKNFPVGISEYDETDNYDDHQGIIEKLLRDEIQNVDVILYTTSDRIKEAFYNDFENAMQLNSKVTVEKELLYWSYCGKDNKVLLVAFENLSGYRECEEYLYDNID